MATQITTIEYLLDQLSGVPGIRARKMFGEYALYAGSEGKVVALVCTDCETEFVNKKTQEFLTHHQITARKNTPYCPEENGKIERFHKTLNEKFLKFGCTPKDSLETLQYKLNLFLYSYNFEKKHRGLGMEGRTPVERLQSLVGVNLTLQWYKP